MSSSPINTTTDSSSAYELNNDDPNISTSLMNQDSPQDKDDANIQRALLDLQKLHDQLKQKEAQLAEEKKKIDRERYSIERETSTLERDVKHLKILNEKACVPSFKVRHPKGVVGLQNLGNTCFMNSALQCIAKTPSLQDYFLSGHYKNEINFTNRLGTGGKLVNAFATLMKQVYAGEYSHISPRFFKFIIGKKSSQFEEFTQQDSAELIQCVLDGLHEDLNRVIDKPLTQPPDGKNLSDHELAQEYWKVHRKRHDSIFVDKVQGQFRTVMECPNCKETQAKFEPFFHLILPVPIPTKLRKIQIALYKLDPQFPIKRYGILVNEDGRVGNLRDEIAKQFNMDRNSFIIAETNQSEICLVHSDTTPLKLIYQQDHIMIYEIPEITDLQSIHQDYDKSKVQSLPWARVNIAVENAHTPFIHQSTQFGTNYKPIRDFVTSSHRGIPFFIPYFENTTNSNLYEYCLRSLKRFQVKELESDNYPYTLKYRYSNSKLKPIECNDHLVDPVNNAPHEKLSGIQNAPTPLIVLCPHEDFGEYFENAQGSDWTGLEHDSSVDAELPKEKPKTLYDCLRIFTHSENLGQDNLWECPKCKEKVDGQTQTDIWKLPETLIIQLNRFQNEGYQRTKLTHKIDFPLRNLDMSEFTKNPNNPHISYDLYAVSNHYGTLLSGHYTSYAKTVDPHTGKEIWHKYDDMNVTEIKEEEIEQLVNSEAGYVLFYQAVCDESVDRSKDLKENMQCDSSNHDPMNLSEDQ